MGAQESQLHPSKPRKLTKTFALGSARTFPLVQPRRPAFSTVVVSRTRTLTSSLASRTSMVSSSVAPHSRTPSRKSFVPVTRSRSDHHFVFSLHGIAPAVLDKVLSWKKVMSYKKSGCLVACFLENHLATH